MVQSISVVIPNFNGRKLLEANLPSVYSALRKADCAYEIIIPDDASTDDSLSFLAENYPHIIVIPHAQNQGFAHNVNAGIKKARLSLIMVLNSDVVLEGDYFSPLLPYFDDPKTFGVMGQIIGLDNDNIQDTGKYPSYNWKGISSKKNFIVKNAPQNFKTPTLFLSGANALIVNEKLQELGGYDEIFSPFYYEDVELSLRAWRLGWHSYFDSRSVCRHPNSVTIKAYHKQKVIKTTAARNKMLMHAIHLQGFDKLTWKIAIGLKFLFSWLTFKTEFYESFQQFRDKKSLAEASRNRFKILLEKYHSEQTPRQIVQKILKILNLYEIEKN
jgi:GT2 family glycosyltransferase